MGWLDFFKKKQPKKTELSPLAGKDPAPTEADTSPANDAPPANPAAAPTPASSEEPPLGSSSMTSAPATPPNYRKGLWEDLAPFHQHLLHAVHIHSRGSTAPLSAYLSIDGSVTGRLYVFADENAIYGEEANVVVDKLRSSYETMLGGGEITAYVLVEHGVDVSDPTNGGAMLVHYRFAGEEEASVHMPYRYDEEGVQYRGFTEFTAEENQAYFATQLEEGKQLWTDKVEMTVPTSTTPAGVEVQLANQFDLRNLYAATVGYRYYNEEQGEQVLLEYVALALTQGPRATEHNVNRYACDRQDLDVIVYKENMQERMKFFLPEVQTDVVIPTTIRKITEWENFGHEVAIVNGQGRATFGLPFLATDYALHRDRYRNATGPLDLYVSGIAFILQAFKHQEGNEEGYAKNFTAYIHSSQLPDYACVDVIAEVKAVREVEVLAKAMGEAYVLTLQLINKDDEPNFFTIDVYVVRESLQLPTPVVGMRVTGMVQLQARLT